MSSFKEKRKIRPRGAKWQTIPARVRDVHPKKGDKKQLSKLLSAIHQKKRGGPSCGEVTTPQDRGTPAGRKKKEGKGKEHSILLRV